MVATGFTPTPFKATVYLRKENILWATGMVFSFRTGVAVNPPRQSILTDCFREPGHAER